MQRGRIGAAVATDMLRDTALSDIACFRTIHLLADGQNGCGTGDDDTNMASARDLAISSDFVDRIDGFAIPKWESGPGFCTGLDVYITRQYMLDFVVATDVAQPGQLHIALETFDDPDPTKSEGFGDPNFPDLLRRALIRSAYCPGDFDLDGVVHAMLDMDAFDDAYGAGDLRADWNFDGILDVADCAAFQISLSAECCDE